MADIPHISQADTDPDARATVTDFLDYTDTFPSDLVRSLTLIGKLDDRYLSATQQVHGLTSVYGRLPSLAAADRPDPVSLRRHISLTLDSAMQYRQSALAEARRLHAVAERHYVRLGVIRQKLQALPMPPLRAASPARSQLGRAPAGRRHGRRSASPPTARSLRTNEAHRVPRITLHMDKARLPNRDKKRAGGRKDVDAADAADAAAWQDGPDALPIRTTSAGRGSNKRRRDQISSDSDDDDGNAGREARDERNDMPDAGRPKIRIPKALKIGNADGRPRSDDGPSGVGSALAEPDPPPPNSKPGSKFAPWFRLTDWEMSKLRKRMKKNTIWTPSETMIRRELDTRGRGPENYEKAKAHAEATGQSLVDDNPVNPSKKVLAPGEISFYSPGTEDAQLVNRGMRLNEAKKLKRESMAREQAARDAMEIDEASRRIADTGSQMKDLFAGSSSGSKLASRGASFADDKREQPNSSKKRTVDNSKSDTPNKQSPVQEPASASGVRKLKLAVPRPTPQPASPSVDGQCARRSPRTSSDWAVVTPTSGRKHTDVQNHSPSDREGRDTPKGGTYLTLTAGGVRPRRSTGVTNIATPASNRLEQASGSARPKTGRDLRRATGGNLPATPDPSALRSSVRHKHANTVEKATGAGAAAGRTEDGGALSPYVVSGRTSAKNDNKEKKNEVAEEEEEEEEDVDPDEARYCLCDRVSFDTMIACDMKGCKLEWFHLECVGLERLPPKNTKWYCPDCRKRHHIDERGNSVDSRSRRR